MKKAKEVVCMWKHLFPLCCWYTSNMGENWMQNKSLGTLRVYSGGASMSGLGFCLVQAYVCMWYVSPGSHLQIKLLATNGFCPEGLYLQQAVSNTKKRGSRFAAEPPVWRLWGCCLGWGGDSVAWLCWTESARWRDHHPYLHTFTVYLTAEHRFWLGACGLIHLCWTSLFNKTSSFTFAISVLYVDAVVRNSGHLFPMLTINSGVPQYLRKVLISRDVCQCCFLRCFFLSASWPGS